MKTEKNDLTGQEVRGLEYLYERFAENSEFVSDIMKKNPMDTKDLKIFNLETEVIQLRNQLPGQAEWKSSDKLGIYCSNCTTLYGKSVLQVGRFCPQCGYRMSNYEGDNEDDE